jgi:PEP-CTERM motif
MTNRLRSLLLAGAASLGLGAFAGPAHALIAVPPPATDFVLVETAGEYTIYNNTPSGSGWYIWAFSVTNPAAADGGGDPSTEQTDWVAGNCAYGCLTVSPSFVYNNYNGAYTDLTDDVGPGQSSGLFFFVAPEDSTVVFQVTNGTNSYNISGGVPEPSTWAMLIAGFGFLGWRYGLKRGGPKRLFPAA